ALTKLAKTGAPFTIENVCHLAGVGKTFIYDNADPNSPKPCRIRRTQEELVEGLRRPCCWPGCKHRERTGK
ncbi:MAG: hypothetical protein KDB44_17825, partial [Mycobacterium sp.]|nr:hypothetical protein [Mycobacterium sp.]